MTSYWISIKDMNPPEDAYILITDGTNIGITYSGQAGIVPEFVDLYNDDNCIVTFPRNITHWMFLFDVELPQCDKCDTVCIPCSTKIGLN